MTVLYKYIEISYTANSKPLIDLWIFGISYIIIILWKSLNLFFLDILKKEKMLLLSRFREKIAE